MSTGVNYCWVVTYCLNRKPYIITCDTRWDALEHVFPKVLNAIKEIFPRITSWREENLDKMKNTRIKEYSCIASGNDNIYVKAYRSEFINPWLDLDNLPGLQENITTGFFN